ncbi:PhoX family protein [Halopseudomonas pelagia]|uniref:PhoX family protein n=1 Tax=Halopseudomonas pelagia TaxID=553151 RepID=UPI0003A93D16|nr:PhoX family phosphatase [Halopseudomonas pelagia]|tara:strand:+ start:118623 stop:120602 length:1980 start_codon:yes stop_codon:yes gene_type:complete
MRQEHQQYHADLQAADNHSINPSQAPSLNSLVNQSRRNLLKGSLAMAACGFFGGKLLWGAEAFAKQGSLLGFTGITAQTSASFDQVIVPPGYTARAFFSWGDAVLDGAPAWQPDASDNWQAQLQQAGDNHDGMHFFPFADAPNSHGLLVINHEYINPTLHPGGLTFVDDGNGFKQRPLEQVRKEQAAHGLSIIEVRRDRDGAWQRAPKSAYNRRISALTDIELAGPLRADPRMKTASDPSGSRVIGTLNNCAMGVTPWGTYLACEENFHNYFVNRDAADYQQRVEHRRYGIGNEKNSRYYAWESVDARFDATPNAEQPHLGHCNEPNRFGWVVEIDPFDPAATPAKRTAMGRLGRECSVLSLGDGGRMAYYSGDDSRGEYVYKFVPEGRFDPAQPAANRRLLDAGTLYAARFNADGSGLWLPLVWGENGLTAENGFADQQAVLLNARGAADLLQATPMDRPEWVAVHPQTREVYVTLTNNSERGTRFPLDAANPRADNLHGQILRWNETAADPTATTFTWEIFLLAGDQPGALDAAGQPVSENLLGTINGDIFSSPDGLAFDASGRLWIQTDSDEQASHTANTGCNQLLCADPHSREVRRFLVGPWGAEITGITWTPDYRSMWINVQHPGISYPASDGQTRPRSTTVLVTREDGGVIGT